MPITRKTAPFYPIHSTSHVYQRHLESGSERFLALQIQIDLGTACVGNPDTGQPYCPFKAKNDMGWCLI